MLTKLRNSSLIIFAMIALVYLTSPWWLASLAYNYLPDEISNFRTNIDYPSLNQLEIQTVQFDLPSFGLRVKLSELSTDYSVTEIKVGSVLVSNLITPSNLAVINSQTLEPRNNPIAISFDLINRIFEDAGVIETINRVTIEKFDYVMTTEGSANSNSIILKNLSLNQAKGKLQVASPALYLPKSMQKLILTEQQNIPSAVNLELDLNSESLVASWQTQELKLVSFRYAKGLEHETIELEAASETLQSLLPDTIGEGVAFKNDLLEIHIDKENATNRFIVQTQSEITINSRNFNRWVESINRENNPNSIKRAVSAQNNIISKVDLKMQLGEEVVCRIDTACRLSLTILIQETLSLSHPEAKIAAESLIIDFNWSFTTENLLSSDALFNFDQGLAKLSADKLLWEQTRVQSLTESNQSGSSTNDSQTTLELTDFEVKINPTLSQAPLARILDEHWSFQANVSSSKLDALIQFGDSTKETKQHELVRVAVIADAGVTAEFNINNQQVITSSGKLIIPKLELDSTYGTAKGSGIITWEEFEKELQFGKAEAELKLMTPKVSDFTFDTALITANVIASESMLNGDMDFSFNDIPLSPIEFKYNKNDQTTALIFTKEEVNLDVVNHLLSIVGEQQKIPLQILGGSLTHSGDVLLAQSALLSSQLDADKITVLFGENKMKGLKLNQLVTSFSPKIFKSNLEIETIDFSSGLQISEISAEIEGRLIDSKENLEFKKVKAKILQGELSSKLVQFIDLEMQPSNIELSGLSLEKLVEFVDLTGLQAEGIIDLNIPIRGSNGQLIVKDGKFQSVGKGVIRYSTGSEETQSEQNIVFQALENFHYESFDGDISYDKDGHYLIKLHLLGSNPEFYDGYPIDFTLNLNGQLTGIFRSLFLTGNFEQAVLDQVEAQRNKDESELKPTN